MDELNRLLGGLRQLMLPLLESRAFEWVFSILILANPCALIPGAYAVIVNDSVEGVSLLMMAMFLAIQVVMTLHAVRTLTLSLFISMLVSAMLSLFIIIVVLVRST